MSVETTDRTGKPRTDDEISDACDVVKQHILTGAGTVPPDLYMQLLCVWHALRELIQRRAADRKEQAS